jgi:hypothetical protein
VQATEREKLAPADGVVGSRRSRHLVPPGADEKNRRDAGEPSIAKSQYAFI